MENKANYETKFSHNEKVFIKKGYYKRHIAKVTDVNFSKEENIYIYDVTIITTKKINNSEIDVEGNKIKIKENMLTQINNNPIGKMFIKILGL